DRELQVGLARVLGPQFLRDHRLEVVPVHVLRLVAHRRAEEEAPVGVAVELATLDDPLALGEPGLARTPAANADDEALATAEERVLRLVVDVRLPRILVEREGQREGHSGCSSFACSGSVNTSASMITG